MSEAKHILGMEPDSICRQMIRNHFAGRGPDQPITLEDCMALMMRFNEWLVDTNETLQKLVLDKLITMLPEAPDPPINQGESQRVGDIK